VLVTRPDGKPARDFTGRLPFAWPADARASLENPLFPVGYGLTYASSSNLGLVNEDPKVDLSSQAHSTAYIVRGKVPAPWHLGIDGSISTKAVDLSAQEDARQFTWNAKGEFAVNGPAINLEEPLKKGWSLTLDWRIDASVKGPVKLAFSGATVDLSEAIRSAPTGERVQTRIPLRCFAESGANFASVGSPIRMQAPKGLVATIRSVHIEEAKESVPCPSKGR